MSNDIVPVALFVYKRPDHLFRTLECLKANRIPLLFVYCDGPKTLNDAVQVEKVRAMVHGIDWCETKIVERDRNMGLGPSIRAGVAEVLAQYDRLIVFEDDLLSSPGTYEYMVAALRHYEDDLRVMSIAAFTHPSVRPPVPQNEAFFDSRFSCWGWGTWRRAWRGMEYSARRLLWECRLRLKDVNRSGPDVSWMARRERGSNTWAVRFGLLHILHDGLCFHPPHSLTNHIGFDQSTTSQGVKDQWILPELRPCPPIPSIWPVPMEHPSSRVLYREKLGNPPSLWKEFSETIKQWRWKTGAVVSSRLKLGRGRRDTRPHSGQK